MAELEVLMKSKLSFHDRLGWFYIEHPDKGWSHIADIRGWGFLTGGGNGALGLSDDEAKAIQDAIANEIVKLWNARLHEPTTEQEAFNTTLDEASESASDLEIKAYRGGE